MKFDKNQIFEAALALNGDDKKYEITIEDDIIITRVKWMDAILFSTDSITDEMKEFKYAVKVNDNGTYTELDKSVEVSKSANGDVLSYRKSVFIGKQITFNKTIALGKNRANGDTGIIDITFNSEEYKAPVRTLLKNYGCKRKMGITGKIFIGAAIFAVAAIIGAVLLITRINNTEPISVSDFESIARSFGYQIGIDKQVESSYKEIEAIRIALDTEDDYQIDYYVLSDVDYAKSVFANNKAALGEIADAENGSEVTLDSIKIEKYSSSTSESYLYIARVENTVLYVNIDIDNKEEAEKFIKELNY